MTCAGYCAYGSATELVVWYGHGVERFTLDPSIGEFILTAENMKIPEKSKTIYSINEGNYTTWDKNMQKAVDDFKFEKPTPYTARYVGSMVSDVHRTLMYGGIYLYPADAAKVIYYHDINDHDDHKYDKYVMIYMILIILVIHINMLS